MIKRLLDRFLNCHSRFNFEARSSRLKIRISIGIRNIDQILTPSHYSKSKTPKTFDRQINRPIILLWTR